MNKNKRMKLVGCFFAIMFLVLCYSPAFKTLLMMPSSLDMVQGSTHSLNLFLPNIFDLRLDNQNIINVSVDDPAHSWNMRRQPIVLESVATGTVNLELRLFGIIPVQKLSINVIPEIELIPGGQAIGVYMQTEGIMVSGHVDIDTDTGLQSPARDCHIGVGDYILAINGFYVNDVMELDETVNQCAQQHESLTITINSSGKIYDVGVKPARCLRTGKYKLGILGKSMTSGVGTLTFIDPVTKAFGALGHVVANSNSNMPLQLRDGKISLAKVTSIQPGKPGIPGQKNGVALYPGSHLGTIEKNCSYGIFGELYEIAFVEATPLPIALMDTVHEGPAEIWTVVEEDKIEKFSINIIKANKQYAPNSKGMIIEIVDQRLLDKTGGIVQGMSGSPIVQDQCLVGAVTHVFLNNPARGYGCYIEFMVLESELIEQRQRHISTIIWPLRRAS